MSRLRRLLDGPDGRARSTARGRATSSMSIPPIWTRRDSSGSPGRPGGPRARRRRASAARDLRAALALWRGPVLADLAGEPFAAAAAHRIDELRVSALEDRIDADLALGRHAGAVPELQSLVAEHPYRERLRGQLMRALYASGRQARRPRGVRRRASRARRAGARAGRTAQGAPGSDPSARRATRRASPPQRRNRRPRPAGVAGSSRPRSLRRPSCTLAAIAAIATTRESGSARTPALTTIPKNSVAVIDPDTNTVVDAIPIGSRPTGSPSARATSGSARSRTRASCASTRARGVWCARSRSASHRAAWRSLQRGGVGHEQRRPFGGADQRTHELRDRTVEDTATEVRRSQLRRDRATDRRTRKRPWEWRSGAGSVWVAQGFSVVSRLDPRTARVQTQVDVAERPNERGRHGEPGLGDHRGGRRGRRNRPGHQLRRGPREDRRRPRAPRGHRRGLRRRVGGCLRRLPRRRPGLAHRRGERAHDRLDPARGSEPRRLADRAGDSAISASRSARTRSGSPACSTGRCSGSTRRRAR